MGITQEFNKQKIIDAIALAVRASEDTLTDLYVKLNQQTQEHKDTSFYKKLFSWNLSHIQSIVEQIDELKYLIKTIQDIEKFLILSDSTTVTIDYPTFKILMPYYKQ